MTNDSFMARYGARLVDSGFPILPIAPGSKAPGQYQGGAWRGYRDWSKHCARPTKAFELRIWEGWPDAGVGVACGHIVALDIDVMDAEAVERIETLAKARLGDTPAIRIGRAPKRLLVYRADKPFSSIKRHPLEILGRGAQFVAYADHPDTGQPYAWPYDSLVDLQLSALPEITEAQARAFLDEACELVPEALRRKRLGEPRSGEHFYGQAGGDLRGTPEAVAAALEWIPNDDLDWDSWIRIGLAIKAAVGEDGAPLWSAWSRKASKSGTSGKSDTPEREWRNFKPHSIGAGTIYRYAMDHGWSPPHGMMLNGAAADQLAAIAEATSGVHPAAPMLARLGEGTPPADPPDAPADLSFVDQAPGLLGEITRWIVRTAVKPQPLLSLGAAVAAVGVLAGQRYRLDRPDTRSNAYIIALGLSSAGKDHPRKMIRRAFFEAGLSHLLGGEQIKSGSGLMAAVTDHPRRLYQIDEFGHFIAAVLDPRSKAHHLREIMTNLTMLSTSATETIPGAEYANRQVNVQRFIQEPCVCVYASTVQDTFWRSLQSGNLRDGSLARFLIFETPLNYPDRQEPEPVEAGLPEILEQLKAIDAGVPAGGNLSGHTICPFVVEMDSEARRLDAAIADEEDAALRAAEISGGLTSIQGRFREHVRRVALIAAVADNPLGTVCTGAHVAWASALVRHCRDTLLAQAERHVADSDYEALQKRCLEIIRRAGRWLDSRELSQKLRFIPVKPRWDLLQDLRDQGELEFKEESTPTKPRTLVRVK